MYDTKRLRNCNAIAGQMFYLILRSREKELPIDADIHEKAWSWICTLSQEGNEPDQEKIEAFLMQLNQMHR